MAIQAEAHRLDTYLAQSGRKPSQPGFGPNELVAPIHPKAMITILHPDDIDNWLRGSYDEVVGLQQPYSAAAMTMRGPVFPTRNAATG